MRQAIKRLLLNIIRRTGYDLIPRGTAAHSRALLTQALGRTAARLPGIKTIIDVGASDGQWTAITRRFYPDAHYLLVEANMVHQPALEAFTTRHPNVEYVLAAAGAEVGEVFFDNSAAFGGVAALEARSPEMIRVPMTSLDALASERGLAGPFAIKLDTHGFEVPILEGAQTLLEQTDLLIIEVYNFRIEDDSLLFYEMCAYLEERGFRPVDLCDPMYRTYDDAFWQMDLFFVRADRPMFDYNRYE